jgi:hypothetical protein
VKTVRGKSMVATRHGSLVIYVHTAEAPNDDEWDRALRFFESKDPGLRALVYTEGAAPNAAQRARLNAALGGNKVAIAVLTPSVVARAAGTAIGWFNPNLRVFGPTDFDLALKHIRATPQEGAELRALIEKLKDELGLPRSVAG